MLLDERSSAELCEEQERQQRGTSPCLSPSTAQDPALGWLQDLVDVTGTTQG